MLETELERLRTENKLLQEHVRLLQQAAYAFHAHDGQRPDVPLRKVVVV